jgi:hypothetical protein
MSALLKPAQAPVDLTSARAAGAALRTFFRLADAWGLSVGEQTTLLGVSRATLYQWKQGKVGPLDRHVLERLSHLFGIYSSLQILFPATGRAEEWLRKPNSGRIFAGRPALDRMLGGQVSDLFVVREYLDAQRGGKA